MEQLSRGEVRGAFFSIHPLTPGPTLGQWLYRWIEAGAVPVLTMNLFLHANDAWHHQVGLGLGWRVHLRHRVGGITEVMFISGVGILPMIYQQVGILPIVCQQEQ